MSKGFSKLALAHCGLTAKGVNQLAHSLSLNQNISNSLTYLDLSGNILKDDGNVMYCYMSCLPQTGSMSVENLLNVLCVFAESLQLFGTT